MLKVKPLVKVKIDSSFENNVWIVSLTWLLTNLLCKLNLLTKIEKSFTVEIVCWILDPKSSKKRRKKRVIFKEPVQEMK